MRTWPNCAKLHPVARSTFKEQLLRTRQYGEHATLPFAQRQQAKLVQHLEQQIAAVEKELAAALGPRPARVQDQVHALAQLDGVGTTHRRERAQSDARTEATSTAAANRRLGGPPLRGTRQSGPWEGQRHIGGGRAVIRRALYMSAVGLARQTKTTLGQFYQRLRLAGKPAKVALTAVMRKLLIQMNQTLKAHALGTA